VEFLARFVEGFAHNARRVLVERAIARLHESPN
jgi:hypothetical protein